MKDLIVSIERNGKMVPAGTISGSDVSNARFQYSEEYLQSPDACSLSISLPLQEQPFSPIQTANYFEGLLPEGFTRRSVAQWMRVDEGDYLSILHGLGRECLGAVSITEPGEEIQASYERVTEEQVRQLASEGALKSAELVTKSHLSLTGASGKVGLYYDEPKNAWYLPRGTAPSTLIVKQSHVRLDAIVTNEQLCLLTAKRCGMSVPDSFIINTGDGGDGEVLFATERYDRVFPAVPKMIGDIPCPRRLHQEDFAQAMGVPSAVKYERESGHYMQDMFDILRRYSSDPIADQLKLWDMIVFDYLIGNTDAHIKNFSLLHSPDMKQVRLAPAYDIISTTIYEQSTRDMAFRIGGEINIDDITTDSFRMAAEQVGLGRRMAMKRFEEMRERFKPALQQSAEELVAVGYSKASEIAEQILCSGGIAKY